MSPTDADLASEPTAAVDHLGVFRRPETQIWAMSAAMVVIGGGLLAILTSRSNDSIHSGGWWAFGAVVVMFAFTEYTVFDVQIRNEGHSFGMSEVPIAFALVFLSPILALVARVIPSSLVLIGPRRNRGYKLGFNLSIYVLETSLAVLIYRSLESAWNGGSVASVLAVVVALIATAPVTSVLISIAIARFEGKTRERIVTELLGTWWLYAVNAAVSAMCIALALFRPALALLAIPAVVGMWHVLRSYGNLAQELRDLDAVHGFAGRVGRTLDVNVIADEAVADIVEHLRADGAMLVRFKQDRPRVHRIGDVPVSLPTDAGDSLWRSLLADAGVRLVPGDVLRTMGLASSASRAVMVAPITDETGPIAVLIVAEGNVQRLRFDDADVARLENLSQQLAVSLRRGLLHERLEYEARHDALTGLPGRRLFESSVAEIVADARSPETSCVLMLDLDRFKEVNDTLGHHAGDDLLQQFAQRMTALLGPADVLARLAGDEFAILCHHPNYDAALDFARSCVREGGRPVVLDGLEIVVTVSVGVARVLDSDHDALQPMRRADIAMYNAKWQRTGVEFYRDEIDRRTPARLSMLGDLRSAIELDELDVVYQPKLDLLSGRIVGVEALVRWEHPTRGLVAPTEFVRVAEDTGLIKELTELVLVRGIKMLRRLNDRGQPISLAVNLSTHDLFDSRLPQRVRAYLDESGVDPDSLTLEITETSLFVDAPRTRATIDDLHEVGIRMAVDDFGTGYSSLSYLRRLPVHELKIDRSFVDGMLRDPQDEVIVRSTVDLGHNLGLLVVAEGVEHGAALDRLRGFGCDQAQGFFISPPVLAANLVDWLERAESSADDAASPAWTGPLN